uniref:Si:ch211-107e6.5 n=1 Tax=Sinocyclocheilus anshuiensis TaxID=1608454 RepID=A0A671S3G9_9TELE
MKQKTGLKGVEVDKTSTAMNAVNLVKLEKPCCPGRCRSRAVFRLLINVHGTPKPDLNQDHLDYRASSASVIHPIGEGHHQNKCCADNQDRSSQETEKQNEEAESPFHQKEQSLLRKAIRILLMLFIILGIIVIFLIASQYVYLEWDRIVRSLGLNKCMNGFVKLRFVGMYNPPI